MDFLRTTYSSRFYYSRNPDLYIVGEYHYASESAEYLEEPSHYGSAVWLDKWDAATGLGDSLENYMRIEGSPVSSAVLNTSKKVLKLRTGCPQPSDTTMKVTDNVYMGFPRSCWRIVPPGPPSERYRVSFLNVVDTTHPDLPPRDLIMEVDHYGVFPWDWYATLSDRDVYLISDDAFTPVPIDTKAFFRWYYFSISYATNFYVELPDFWWSGVNIASPAIIFQGTTTAASCGQLIIERLD